MNKKISLFLIITLCISLASFSLDINNLNGAFYIMKQFDNGEFQITTNIRVQKKDNERPYDSTIRYSVDTDSNYKLNEFEFVEIDGEIYVTFIEAKDSPVYLVLYVTDFGMTLINVDDQNDVLKIVFDKEYNGFKYDIYYKQIQSMDEDDFRAKLHNMIDNQIDLGYKGARYAFFSDIDNVDGYVTCVYTGKKVKTKGIPGGMNCEHTWPQSAFGKGEESAKKDDIHHLFPSDVEANSKRYHWHFVEVEKVEWEKGGSVLGKDSEGETVFEPRDDHKGDVARAQFYFSVRYNMPIDEKQEKTFRKWHVEDPVSEKEIMRNNGIEECQKNRNPFIDRPDFVDKITDF